MKLLKCIIRPDKLDDVKEALSSISIHGMTVSEVRGLGWRRSGNRAVGDGDLAPQVEIEVVVPDSKTRTAMEVMIDAARSGNTGDGKLFIMNVDQAVRIRTGESDEGAL